MNVLAEKRPRRKVIVGISLAIAILWKSPLNGQVPNELNADHKIPAATEKTILFGSQDKEITVQSQSSIDGNRLKNRLQAHMGSAIYGTLPGLQISINNGMVNASVEYTLRGRTPIIMVDGIPRSNVNVPVEQIESISIIKDAVGLSLIGMMGSGGVVNITTKKGADEKMKVNATVQFGFSDQIFKPKNLNSFDYATLFNEALRNDKRPLAYTEDDLNKYKNGTSPYTHPDIDWYDYLLKDNAFVQQYNLNFLGGGKVARYFIDLNYFDQAGYLKQDKNINSYPTSESYEKYSLRTRVDVNITPETFFTVNLFGQMYKENSPGTLLNNIYFDLATTPNNAYAPVNPDGSLGGNRAYTDNLYGQSIYKGYYAYNASDFNFDTKLAHHFTGPLAGLSLSALYSYNATYRETVNRSKEMDVFAYNPQGAEGEQYTQLSNATAQANSSGSARQNRLMYVEAAAGYDFSIGEHNSSNQIQYSYNNYLIQNKLPFNNYGVSGRFQYDYAKRYMAEFSWSYMGMNQFKSGNRMGFFPAAGLGWNITNEEWFSEKVPAVSFLKLKTTYGLTGDNLAASYLTGASNELSYYYDYQYYYVGSSSAYFGNTAASTSTVIENGLPYVTKWSKTKMFNIGVDAAFLNDNITFSAEYFNNTTSGVLRMRGTNYSSIIGTNLPMENIGKQRISGIDLAAGYTGSSNDFTWNIDLNASIYKTKELFMDEPTYPYTYMNRTGKPIGQLFGYVSDGIFSSQQEVDQYLTTHTVEGYIPKPGDLRYKDLNGDKIIDGKDITEIGNNKPTVVYGMHAGVSWKGLGLNMQWAGVGNREILEVDMPFPNISVNGNYGTYGQATTKHLNRWTENNPNADLPRLSVGDNTYNQAASSFWVKNASYLRLKHLELSYDLPLKWISHVGMSRVQLFATGYNLLTISPLKDRDPEVITYLVAPNSKAVTFGLNIQF